MRQSSCRQRNSTFRSVSKVRITEQTPNFLRSAVKRVSLRLLQISAKHSRSNCSCATDSIGQRWEVFSNADSPNQALPRQSRQCRFSSGPITGRAEPTSEEKAHLLGVVLLHSEAADPLGVAAVGAQHVLEAAEEPHGCCLAGRMYVRMYVSEYANMYVVINESSYPAHFPNFWNEQPLLIEVARIVAPGRPFYVTGVPHKRNYELRDKLRKYVSTTIIIHDISNIPTSSYQYMALTETFVSVEYYSRSDEMPNFT